MSAAGSRRLSNRAFAIAALVVTLLIAGGLSLLASSSPDGLEHVAETKGFADTAQEHEAANGPLADYQVKGVEDERASGALAGIAGVAITGALMGGLVLVLRRRDGGSAAAGRSDEARADDADTEPASASGSSATRRG